VIRKYKVVDILDGRLILAQNIDTLEKVVFKVLEKSSGILAKNTNIIKIIIITRLSSELKHFSKCLLYKQNIIYRYKNLSCSIR